MFTYTSSYLSNFLIQVVLAIVFVNSGFAAPTLEERKNDIIYMETGLGLDNVGSGYLSGYQGIGVLARVGARLSPSLGAEVSFSSSSELFNTSYNERLTVGVNWMVMPNFSISGGIGARRLYGDDSDSFGATIGKALGTVAGVIVCSALTDGSCEPVPVAEEDTIVIGTETVDLGIELGLSSQWQWRFLTLGVEWAAIYQPVAILQQNRTITNITKNTAVSLNPDLKLSDVPINARFATITLGASF